MRPRPILVASIGNPLPYYADTFHSAGHTILTTLISRFVSPTKTPPRSASHKPIFIQPDFALWHSPAFMNLSGPVVKRTWYDFCRTLPDKEEDPSHALLVVLHDELELPLGKVRSSLSVSCKGHHGLRSCLNSLGEIGYLKISIGIGRPESREPADVARHVMSKMGQKEKKVMHGAAGVVEGMLRGYRERTLKTE